METECNRKVNALVGRNPGLKQLVAKFGGDCPLPRLHCVTCAPEGICGAYDNRNGVNTLTICMDQFHSGNEASLEKTLWHELTHALQWCKAKAGTRDCADSIAREMQAYYCSRECNEFSECLGLALGSSCGPSGYCKNGSEVVKAYDSLADQWNKKGDDAVYCFAPRPDPPKTPTPNSQPSTEAKGSTFQTACSSCR